MGWQGSVGGRDTRLRPGMTRSQSAGMKGGRAGAGAESSLQPGQRLRGGNSRARPFRDSWGSADAPMGDCQVLGEGCPGMPTPHW